MRIFLLIITCFFASSQLFANEAQIEVTNGWVRETPPGVKNAAAFFTLSNRSEKTRQLINVQCEATLAARCEIHEHIHNETGMRMQKVEAPLNIPAAGSMQFTSGGYHVMLIGLLKPLLAGSTVDIIFLFDDQSTYHAQLPVKPIAQE